MAGSDGTEYQCGRFIYEKDGQVVIDRCCDVADEGYEFEKNVTAYFVEEDGSVFSTVAHGWLSDESFHVVSVPKGECIWAIEKYSDVLRHPQGVSKAVLLEALQMLVHEIGDMHCPSHVHFTDGRDRNDLKFNVYYKKKKVRLHTFFDSILLEELDLQTIDISHLSIA